MGAWAETDGFALLLGALLILTLPISWLVAALLAAIFHELCHILAVKALGGKIHAVTIGLRGTILDASPMSPEKALISALAGPMGSLFLLAFLRYIPRIALCAGVQGLFNLLPVYPLDGGRIFQCTSRLLLPEDTAARLCLAVNKFLPNAILCLAILGTIRLKLGIFPILAALMLRKIPCKDGNLGVQ